MSFEAADFFHLDDQLTDAERSLRDRVRSWVDERALPLIAEHNRAGTFPRELLPDLAGFGAFGAHLHGYGCAGLGPRGYGVLMRELERADSGLRTFASVQGALAMTAIHDYGDDQQRHHWLPLLARAEAISCFGLTEPGSGSDPASLTTTATYLDDGWILRGEKMWIGNGSIADVAVVWAKVCGVEGIDSGTASAVRGFLVPANTPGFTTQLMEGKLSLRAAVTSTLHFDDCPLPASALLSYSGGLKSALGCLNHARYGISWGVIGAAMACYDEARQYVMARQQFGGVLADTQLVQARLADMLTSITQAQLMASHLAQLKQEETITPQQISMGKMSNVDAALGVAREARDLLGGVGILDRYQSFRHLANLESVRTYEGTHDVHRLILGQAITGSPAFAARGASPS